MSLDSWHTTMQWRWLKVPLPTSCPLIRILNPVEGLSKQKNQQARITDCITPPVYCWKCGAGYHHICHTLNGVNKNNHIVNIQSIEMSCFPSLGPDWDRSYKVYPKRTYLGRAVSPKPWLQQWTSPVWFLLPASAAVPVRNNIYPSVGFFTLSHCNA